MLNDRLISTFLADQVGQIHKDISQLSSLGPKGDANRAQKGAIVRQQATPCAEGQLAWGKRLHVVTPFNGK